MRQRLMKMQVLRMLGQTERHVTEKCLSTKDKKDLCGECKEFVIIHTVLVVASASES